MSELSMRVNNPTLTLGGNTVTGRPPAAGPADRLAWPGLIRSLPPLDSAARQA